MKILVTGGCGYIGAHTIIDLLDKGYEVVCIDNLSRSKSFVPDRIREVAGKDFTQFRIDLRDLPKLRTVLHDHQDIQGIIHFAAFKSVSESTRIPLIYYDNNLNANINILRIADEYQIKHFILSSSCSVYGNVQELPVKEDTPMSMPESPYGWTKLLSEEMIRAHAPNTETKCIALRYFNPVGAHPGGMIGEIPFSTPENLVPNITRTAIGLQDAITVHGTDYPTRDGSCVRDYVHVMDIAEAHRLALEYSMRKVDTDTRTMEVFNLGSGTGISVLELIHAFERVSDMRLSYTLGPRREGDVVAIYADNTKAKEVLGWECSRNIDDMMSTAWKWEQQMQKEGLSG